jgi:hypothetical protein
MRTSNPSYFPGARLCWKKSLANIFFRGLGQRLVSRVTSHWTRHKHEKRVHVSWLCPADKERPKWHCLAFANSLFSYLRLLVPTEVPWILFLLSASPLPSSPLSIFRGILSGALMKSISTGTTPDHARQHSPR